MSLVNKFRRSSHVDLSCPDKWSSFFLDFGIQNLLADDINIATFVNVVLDSQKTQLNHTIIKPFSHGISHIAPNSKAPFPIIMKIQSTKQQQVASIPVSHPSLVQPEFREYLRVTIWKASFQPHSSPIPFHHSIPYFRGSLESSEYSTIPYSNDLAKIQIVVGGLGNENGSDCFI